MTEFLIDWQYEGGHEMPRTDYVEARDANLAIEEVFRRHRHPGTLRGEPKIIDIRGVDKPGVP